ncbi:MAG: glycosyltransferase family 2 protein [Caldilinea sp.]|nr:glycosyltransferase family 2 protein [Caldilinea sp.]MDW8441283.1 glycosyltransferase family 2 protein [Caldilineaceae bacterium]
MKRRIRLAAIVVSYNVRDLLRRSLHSLMQAAATCADRFDLQVVVVDNASCDGSAEMTTDEFPQVRLIASRENLGFTRANNLALRELGFATAPARPPVHFVNAQESDVAQSGARPDYVLLLNPDAEVTDGALPRLVNFLERTPQAAACGAELRYSDGSFQHSAFRFPGLFQVLFDLFPPLGVPGGHRLLNSRLNGRYASARWSRGEPFPVDFVLGAAMMVRGAAIDAVGGLDESFWMYCEEMDWCRRFRRAGWSVYALPGAQVIHHEAQSSRQRRWDAQVHLWHSRFRFYAKYRDDFPPGTLATIRLLVRAGMAREARRLERRFAAGELDGVELFNALAAIDAISRTATSPMQGL